MSTTQVLTLQNFIAGSWVDSTSDATTEDINPADPSDVLAQVPLSPAADARAAIDAAAAAFPGWRATSAVRRGEIVAGAGRMIEARAEELAQLLTREQGKTLAESRGEVGRVVQFCQWMGYQGGSLQGVTAPAEASRMLAMTLREPLGVVTLITPWNFPANIPNWKLASALVCGNTVVLKPAKLTPKIAIFLVEAYVEAGLPAGVVNLVLGAGRELGEVLVTDPRVKAISFTGSTAVGLGINAKAAALGKKVQAEMGGHNALIVLADADLCRAAAGAAAAAYGTTGQRCTAARRVIAVPSVVDELTEHLRGETRRLKVGPGADPGIDIGPLVDGPSRDDVIAEIERARSEGAVVLEGGRTPDRPGYFLEPTLLGGVRPEMTIASEEVFGPVLPIMVAGDFDEAVALANSTRYGLSSSIYTRDLNLAIRFMHETDSGVVHVNKPPIGAEAHLPFGGLKESALGSKELGAAADFFTQTKTVYVDWS